MLSISGRLSARQSTAPALKVGISLQAVHYFQESITILNMVAVALGEEIRAAFPHVTLANWFTKITKARSGKPDSA